jgi:hypothetical protein
MVGVVGVCDLQCAFRRMVFATPLLHLCHPWRIQMSWALMITLLFILLSLYALPRLVLTLELVDGTVSLNFLALHRVDTTTPKLVGVNS